MQAATLECQSLHSKKPTEARLNVGFFLGGIKCYTVRRQCHTLKGVIVSD